MPFIRIPGFEGKIFVPDENEGAAKKHNCRDCYACAFCGDDRCEKCLRKKNSVSISNPDPEFPKGT